MDSPPPSASSTKLVFSTPSSPVLPSNKLAHSSNTSHPRHMSDVSSNPVGFGPRSGVSRDPTAQFKFGDIITSTGQQLPKRVFQGNKKDLQTQSSMSQVVRGSDLPALPGLSGDRGRHSIAGPSMRPGSKSRSPHSRLGAGARSTSPGNPMHARTMSPFGRSTVQDSAPPGIDMRNAYRQLSDANRLRAGGLLAISVGRKKSDDEPGGGRLVKDYLHIDGHELPDDSSDDQDESSQDEDERGRKADRDFEQAGGPATSRVTKSLLAAAEEERKSNPSVTSAGKYVTRTAGISSDDFHHRTQRYEEYSQAEISITL